MTMRRIFLCAVIALALWMLIVPAPRALAQDPNRLAQLKISIWPEYDKPTVLVLLDDTLADSANLPREVSVLIPASATLHVTTFQNADGTLAPEQSSKSTDLGDGYTRVTFTTRTPQYRLEYYHDLLRGAPDKTMDFVFKAIAPADQVSLEIQQPLKATNFSITPTTQTTRTDANGFKYYTLQYANVAAGQTITAQVKYTKSDPNPSVQFIPTPVPIPAQTPASPSVWDNLFVIIAIVLLGLVAVLGFFTWQQRLRETYPALRAPSRRRARRAPEDAAGASGFCTQCGRALGPDDNFCPRCGRKRSPS